MSVVGDGTERGDAGADEPGWEVDPDDESGAAVVAAVGRQIKAWREAAGMRAAEFGAAMGYGEDLVYKAEGGRRIPRPEFMDGADVVLGAGGKLAAMKADIAEVRYPKKIRELAKMEAAAVELVAYSNSSVHGLLQTAEYARALFAMRQPAYPQEEIERAVAARLARQTILERQPSPTLGFVLEEVVLRRPLGGKMVLRHQLEHLLAVTELRNVTVQVMPMDLDEHAGIDGEIQVLKFKDGTAVGRSDGAFGGRPVSDPKQVRILDLRCGMIRAQALTPRESTGFIERALGET
ncbi:MULTISPECIES: helix-turn-helix transcriptional regulator [Streptomyces]|uniref:helix-turn-helix domain-containing protein n=1 Tax=Streptomyces TaxID=1883 RepID=UPI0010386BDF|nr:MULTISPECIES: helix-turn-helix transcriptional regulator [Streptomyces]MBT3074445.1 helix-turn-helix domain-containing protein [Streptomyces sp. COG21]MBT3083032.1 helix-turn-helix domain-containing protein [Streptomyces sp. COG20]MBT3085912.1 helix-turn-helix domain-containing protein [Streptomyces sp. CYG21]MBT3096637.1 helix-turn-helix domain-containing protein [Streptomyces sp. CBG30]MBT3105226.1 helix-turn-helix domain-containing protein [Streptomyces sp. COG19]